MCLNGRDIEEWGLTPWEGTYQTLMKPAPMKDLTKNENSSVHGTMLITTPSARRYKAQDMSLMFYIDAKNIVDLDRRVQQLSADLVNGKKVNGSYTGVNELTIPELGRTYRLTFNNQIEKFSVFGLTGAATISIKFHEPNPNNRAI